jgi:uncharacterized protein
MTTPDQDVQTDRARDADGTHVRAEEVADGRGGGDGHDAGAAGSRPHRDGAAVRDVPRHHRWAAGHVIVAVLIALSFGALLNAADLLATAERQEFGATRTVSVAVAERVLAVSEFLRLDRPRQSIDQALGRVDPVVGAEGASLDDEVELEPAPSPGDETLAAPFTPEDRQLGVEDPPFRPRTEGAEDGGAFATGVTRRTPTEDEPLTLYIGGDSMVGQFGGALEDLAGDTGVIETTEVVYEFGSGITRPDFIDWPAKLAQVSAEQDPELIVLYFGGNDAQPLQLDGVVYEPEDDEWQAEYRTRVNALMTQLQDAGHLVYWMGMPIPRSETLQQRYLMLNEIYSTEADAHESVTYVAAWDTFTDENGNYSEFLPNANGDMTDMRLQDGIHYTTAGAYRIARVAADRIIDDHGIAPAS